MSVPTKKCVPSTLQVGHALTAAIDASTNATVLAKDLSLKGR